MLQILTVVCLLGVSSMAMGGGGEGMIKKYAYMKIMESCIGKEAVMQWKMGMKAACDKCKGEDVKETITNIQAMLKDMQRKYASPFSGAQQRQNTGPLYVPVPVYINNPSQLQQASQFPQFQQFSNFRTKRSMHDMDLSPEGIMMMKKKMMAKISNVTCVLQEMKCITADKQPNYEYFNEQVNNLQVSDMMKEDFLEAMDECRDFAMCMPVEKAKTPMKRELGTAFAFMKCIHMKKVEVCMKSDFQKYAPMFGYEGDMSTPEGQELADEITAMMTEGFEGIM